MDKKQFTQQIISKIEEIEAVSSVELVIIPYERSANYWEYNFMGAIIFSFLVSFYMMVSPKVFDFWFIFFMIWGSLVVGFAISEISIVKRLLIASKTKKRIVNIMANAIFSKAEIHKTKDRTGILIFISFFEKEIAFIPDLGVKKVLAIDELKNIEDKFSQIAKSKNFEKEFFDYLDKLKEIFQNRLPIKPDDINELDDNLFVKIKF